MKSEQESVKSQRMKQNPADRELPDPDYRSGKPSAKRRGFLKSASSLFIVQHSAFLLILLLLAQHVLARAGGGEGYGGGGGHGGGGGGIGDLIDLIMLLIEFIWLLIVHPFIGFP